MPDPLLERLRRAYRRPGAPVVTYTIILACTLLWVLEVIPGLGPQVVSLLAFSPARLYNDPFAAYTVFTGGFLHDPAFPNGIVHLGLNMYTLWIFGQVLETRLGRGRYIALYVLTLAGGSLGVWALAPTTYVVGASGALFGLMGALLVLQRRLGADWTQLAVLLAINFAWGLFFSGISWQGHLGGAVVGAFCGLALATNRHRSRRWAQGLWLGVIGVGVLVGFLVTPDLIWPLVLRG